MVDQAEASFSQRLLFVVVVLLPQIASGASVLGDVQVRRERLERLVPMRCGTKELKNTASPVDTGISVYSS